MGKDEMKLPHGRLEILTAPFVVSIYKKNLS